MLQYLFGNCILRVRDNPKLTCCLKDWKLEGYMVSKGGRLSEELTQAIFKQAECIPQVLSWEQGKVRRHSCHHSCRPREAASLIPGSLGWQWTSPALFWSPSSASSHSPPAESSNTQTWPYGSPNSCLWSVGIPGSTEDSFWSINVHSSRPASIIPSCQSYRPFLLLFLLCWIR